MKFQKNLTKKVKSIMQSDMLAAVAMVSILANVFFIIGVGLFITTNKLDKSAYSLAFQNLCIENYEENAKVAAEDAANPDLALIYFDMLCGGGEFDKYHEEAVQKYLKDKL